MAKRRAKDPDDYFLCPHCGARVKAGAAACKKCGADAETGWSDDADEWYEPGYAVDEDEDDEYQEFLRREFPDESDRPASNLAWPWRTTAIAVLLVLFYLILHGW